jgi:hypothetical protein
MKDEIEQLVIRLATENRDWVTKEFKAHWPV